MNVWTLMIQRNLMIPRYFMIQRGISIGSMDFDNPKVYGDTSIFDSLVLYGHQEAPQIKVLVQANLSPYAVKIFYYGEGLT